MATDNVPLKNPRFYMRVVEYVQQQIDSKQLVIGDRLSPERKLSLDLEVSRTVVREAMIALELMGIAEIRSGSGVYIINDQVSNLYDKTILVSPIESLEARCVLEPQLVKLATQKASKDELNQLGICIQMMEASVHFSDEKLREAASIDSDRQFHRLIAQASQNSILTKMHGDLMALHMRGEIWQRMDQIAHAPAKRGYWNSAHKAIYQAMCERNAQKASDLMEQHLNHVIEVLTESLPDDETSFKSN